VNFGDLHIHDVPLEKTLHCATHGDFVAKCYMGDTWGKCPVCQGERDAAERAEKERVERLAKLQAWRDKIGQSGIPERFHDRSLKSFVAATPMQVKALEFSTKYADQFDDVLKFGRCAVFVGKPGTGKTHLAAGIGLRLMHRDQRTVLFSTVFMAIERIKDTWNRPANETTMQAYKNLIAVDLLILDEIGVQYGSDAEKLILFNILNARYEKRRPVLLLSNMNVEQVKQYLGDRIADRLREDGGEFVVFDWESYRGKN
jgi:DNA replication protein DnaC